jgi:hypothetical protein
VNVSNQPACLIVSPGAGAMLAVDVSITFDAMDPSNDLLSSAIEYSTDAGATWALATAAAGSPTANPDPPRPTPIVGQVFVWSTILDGVGLPGPQNVTLRITVDDTFTTGQCTVLFQVLDNAPTCTITAPLAGAMVSGDVDIVFDGDEPASNPVTSTIEFSTDAGATWNLATAAAGSPTSNPDPARPTPFTGLVFTWDSQLDGVGLLGPELVDVRVVTDSTFAVGSCSVLVTADNQPFCTITSPLPGADAVLDMDIVFDGDDPSMDPVTSTIEYSDDGGVTWFLATPSATSAISNPDVGRATPFTGVTFTWDSQADLAATVPPAVVLLRVTMDDTATSGTCQTDVVFSCFLCGDCDLNGVGPTILDSLAAAQISSGLIVPSPQQLVCCDTDSSMSVTILDALVMAQFAAGLPVVLVCP